METVILAALNAKIDLACGCFKTGFILVYICLICRRSWKSDQFYSNEVELYYFIQFRIILNDLT